jgi:hypothetical protein
MPLSEMCNFFSFPCSTDRFFDPLKMKKLRFALKLLWNEVKRKCFGRHPKHEYGVLKKFVLSILTRRSATLAPPVRLALRRALQQKGQSQNQHPAASPEAAF